TAVVPTSMPTITVRTAATRLQPGCGRSECAGGATTATCLKAGCFLATRLQPGCGRSECAGGATTATCLKAGCFLATRLQPGCGRSASASRPERRVDELVGTHGVLPRLRFAERRFVDPARHLVDEAPLQHG